ncbi:hypothetical protein ACWEIK_22140 [Streptomyces sp. NPDC004673]
MSSPDMTVGDLIDLLSECDRSAPVRQAMNPFFPMEHRLEQAVQFLDKTSGQTVVYLAEGRNAETQLGVLPLKVAVALAWQGSVQAPPRRPRRRADGK